MDLIDLFIGSEGTLGIIRLTVDTIPRPAFSLVYDLDNRVLHCRGRSTMSRLQFGTHDRPLGVSAILAQISRAGVLPEGSVDRKNNVSLPADTEIALLVTIELTPETGRTGLRADRPCR
jgi:hypothetical protein